MAIQVIEGLNYKKSLHIYVLDNDYYTQRSAQSLADILRSDNSTGIDTVISAYLTRASVILYNYIYSFNPNYKDYLQYLFCHNKKYAECIRECLVELVNYWTLNGLDSSILSPILTIDVTRTVPFLTEEQIKSSLMPESVKMMVKNAGLNIAWGRMVYDESIFDEYEEEERILAEV